MKTGRRLFINLTRNWYNLKSFFREIQKEALQVCSVAIPALLFIALGMVIYDFGFQPFWSNNIRFNFWLAIILDILIILMGLRLVLDFFIQKRIWARFFTIAGWVFVLVMAFYILPQKAAVIQFDSNRFLFLKMVLYAGIVLGFITEASYLLQYVYNRSVNPGLLFVASFAFLILLGAFMLKLPNATTQPLSAIDALFTSASAVCVTGLIVVDTATHFTLFGQLLILTLIQIGALGIMTFAGLLAYAVAGGASFKSQLAFKDMFSSRQINNVMFFVYQVVLVTLLFEAIGTVLIYFSLDDALFARKLDKFFFSVFHAVSAFCNAGFSTYTNGLYEPVIRYNYDLQLIITILIIMGGMGFPIVFNLSRFIKIKLINLFRKLSGNPKRSHFPRLINLNSRLALVVSGFLLILGFVAYFSFEQYATLANHPTLTGKVITSFFGSVTPRTAGFNTVDLSAMTLPTVMIYLLLMWVGASPGSTGGGIKTTTAGVALLNVASVLRGKDRTEFFRSEISHQSVRRAFAVIIMSLLFIGVAVFLIAVNDSEKGLIKIAFEAFSAFSTVGLTLGITPNLSEFSKVVLIITMFVGRVGTVTLLVAFIRQSKQLYYRYPKEEITL
ncbi:MAG TPA: potassium transporter TrkG [Flavisolibacter sp.]|nr:potassium transporter TrkG [Flavisolibacter sp.]